MGSFTEAMRLGPGVTTSDTGYSVGVLIPHHRFDDALQLLRDALRQDPASLTVQRAIGEVQLLSGRYQEAVETPEVGSGFGGRCSLHGICGAATQPAR